MTITTDYSPVQYNGNGVTTSFAFPYTFYDDTDLIVTTTVVSTGVDTVRVLNTDYTVTGGDGANGTVVFGTAPASGVRVTIEVDIPYRQEDDYVENQAFPADTLEQSLDRAVIRDQQLKSAVDRSVKFPATLAGSLVGLLPQPVDGKLLVWDGTSGQIGNADIADVSSTLNTIITTPVSGEVLTWNGTNWVNDDITIPNNFILTAMIANNQITEAKIADFSVSYYKVTNGALATTANIISGTVAKLVNAESLAPLYYGCKLYQTTGTSVTIDTWTNLLFDTEAWDDNAWHSTSTNTDRITFDFTGRVFIIGCYAPNTATNASFGVRVLKNGTVVARDFGRTSDPATENLQVNISCEIDVASGDYIQLQGFNSNGTITSATGISGTTFSARRIK